MATVLTFYLSRVIGYKVYSESKKVLGRLMDFVVDISFERPKIVAALVKFGNQSILIDYANIRMEKVRGKYLIICHHIEETYVTGENMLYLKKHVLDKQIVDIDGKKIVRVNDLRLCILASGTFVIAVDVGTEGLLRRLSVAKPIKKVINPFGLSMPSRLILWDDVERISFQQEGIKLSKTQTKLSTLHPSDLADIIEDLDRNNQVALFASLDDEKAADVLEELESDAQVNLMESLSVERAADVLEKMPADEVADILDDLDEGKAEEILTEMDKEASEEVRELMEYPENTVGSLMTTDHISFREDMTINETLSELRDLKPESDTIYYLYVLDASGKLSATVSLRDIVVSPPETKLNEISNKNVIKVLDTDKIDSLAEIISKYNLLAIPVVNKFNEMEGMVIIDDIVFTLLKARRRKG